MTRAAGAVLHTMVVAASTGLLACAAGPRDAQRSSPAAHHADAQRGNSHSQDDPAGSGASDGLWHTLLDTASELISPLDQRPSVEHHGRGISLPASPAESAAPALPLERAALGPPMPEDEIWKRVPEKNPRPMLTLRGLFEARFAPPLRRRFHYDPLAGTLRIRFWTRRGSFANELDVGAALDRLRAGPPLPGPLHPGLARRHTGHARARRTALRELRFAPLHLGHAPVRLHDWRHFRFR